MSRAESARRERPSRRLDRSRPTAGLDARSSLSFVCDLPRGLRLAPAALLLWACLVLALAGLPASPAGAQVPTSCDAGWLAKLTMGYDIVSTTNFSNETIGYDSDSNFGALSRKKIPHGPTSYTIAEILRTRTTNTNTDTVVTDAVAITVAEGELPDGTVLNFGANNPRLVVGADSATTIAGQDSWDVLGTDFPDWEEGSYTLMCANLPPRLRLKGAKVSGRYLGLEYHQALDFNSVPPRSAYEVKVDGAPRVVTDVFVPDWMSRVVLTLASPVTDGQTVTVAYTQPASNPLQDASGLYALPLDAYPVPYETGDLFPHNRPATGKPKIIGEVKVGSRLRASRWETTHKRHFDDPNYMRARSTWFYRWVRVGEDSTETEIGSNSEYYEVRPADSGSRIKVEVSFLDLRGNPERVVSNPVGPVLGTGHQETSTDEEAPLTASFEDLPESHDGEKAFSFNLVFNQEVYDGDESVNKNQAVREALTITGGRARASRQLVKGSFDAFRVEVEPEGPDTITIALVPPLGDCTEETPTCTPDGRKLTTLLSFQVPGPQQEQGRSEGLGRSDTTPALTAGFEDLPAEHDGKTVFTVELAFSKPVFDGTESFDKNGKIQNALQLDDAQIRGRRRADPAAFDRWIFEIRPSGNGGVTVTLPATEGKCGDSGAICTPDDVPLAAAATATIPGPPGLSVADAEVDEDPGATLAFAVTLSRASSSDISVDYATVDGSAEAGRDYDATSGVLTFLAGETSKTINVDVLDDSEDEGNQTLTLTLTDPSGGNAFLADDTATGTIRNSDLMPQAWLARFGRTVAEQVLDAVEGRLRSAPPAGAQVTVAGQRLGGEAPDAEALEEAKVRLASLSAWIAGETEARESGFGSRPVAPGELLTGSSFALTAGADGLGGGLVSLWGRGAVSRFDGREDDARHEEDVALDGEVTGALLGADWTRERWTAGLMLSHARGEGGYRGASSGEVSSTVTGLYPYGRYSLSERVTLWGVAGYGSGELVLTPEDGGTYETDMDLAMAAAGLRGVVVEAPEGGGPELAVKTDALGVRTSSEAVQESAGAGKLAAATADVTRLRLGLEGLWQGLAIGTGTLTPRLEVGVRHDGGDAETGFGLDFGGGLAWSDPETGIRAEASGRGLLTHESAGFRQRGIAGSFGWDPAPGSNRGPSLTLTQTMGLAASGGSDALLGRRTLAGLAANDDGEELERRRLDVKFGYGFAAFGDRFTATPELGFGLSAGARDYRLGWRLTRAARFGGALELALEGRRRESANDDARPEDSLGFRITARW